MKQVRSLVTGHENSEEEEEFKMECPSLTWKQVWLVHVFPLCLSAHIVSSIQRMYGFGITLALGVIFGFIVCSPLSFDPHIVSVCFVSGRLHGSQDPQTRACSLCYLLQSLCHHGAGSVFPFHAFKKSRCTVVVLSI